MTVLSRRNGLKTLPLEPISSLAPFSALIIYLIPRLYGRIYTNLSVLNQRGFINHHIAGFTKILILILAAYPFIAVISGRATLQTHYVHGSVVRMGDVLVVAAQMLIAMYVFELIYRAKLSPIAVMHHIGTIIIGQSAIAISLRLAREPDADIEFVLCTVWGAFDIISEFFPHVAIILYRVFPTRHHFLLSCITTAMGTTCETIVTMWLFGGLWARWQMAFKVVTPILHVAFSAAQIHGSVALYKMYRRQKRLMEERGAEEEEEVEVERGPVVLEMKAGESEESKACNCMCKDQRKMGAAVFQRNSSDFTDRDVHLTT